MRAVTLAVLLLGVSQRPDQGSNAWPIDTPGAGGFSAKRLAAAPAIDGRQWIDTLRQGGRLGPVASGKGRLHAALHGPG